MDEYKIENSFKKKRDKFLIDWGVSIETAKTIETINQLLDKGSYDLSNQDNLGHALLIGILNRCNAEFSKFSEREIGAFINTGIKIMQERKQKRLAPGIVTRHKFDIAFSNGGEIFNFLMDQNIFKKLTLTKGYLKEITDQHRQLIKGAFPKDWGKILAVLEVSQNTPVNVKHQHFYEKDGVQEWLKI